MNESLFAVVRTARRRWRTRLVLRGLAVVAGAGLAFFLLGTFGMDRLRFDATAVAAFRLLGWGGLAVLTWRFLIRPLARRVSDEQVALYLEEHEPRFEGHLLSAVAFAGRVDGLQSRALVDRMVQQAVRRCESLHEWRDIERRGIRRAGGALAGTALAGLAVLLLNPGFVRYGAPFMLRPFGAVDGGSPYAIAVMPGDTVLARGADLTVTATLRNFDAADVELALRRGTANWERWPMPADESGARTLLVFQIDSATQYFVEAAGVRSPVYTVHVEDLPYVAEISKEYQFPAYTGLRPREEDGGDVAALAGTRVRVAITPTLPVTTGALILNGTDTLPLTAGGDGGLSAAFTVATAGDYRVVFPAPDGRLVDGSPGYFIDVLADQPPLVRFTTPGRDIDVTSIDEVFLEASAEDDFGIRQLELVYQVNGGPEQTVPLYGPGARQQVTAGHTLFLEELSLQPGDFVSYHARARDARPDGATEMTDIYFLSIRPFDRSFREAEQQGGQGGQPGMGVGELSQRQRQIIAGTFKVMRDRADMSEAEFRDHMTTLTLSQGRLREEVETLERRIRSRGIARLDSAMIPVAEALPQAIEEMRRAEVQLGRRAPRDALQPEQRSLQHLQRAEAVFQREQDVSRGNPAGGAQGGEALNDDLAELFELEADKLRNQYEQADRDVREQVNQEIDETLEKLRQLAQRQQQQDERRRAEARQGGNATGTPSDAQRRLADEAEDLARRLERLSRERSRADLADAARRIREAADAMRQSARRQGGATGGAADRLAEAQRRLEQSRSAGLERDVDDALERARRLARQQDAVTRDVEQLDDNPGERAERVRQLEERKDLMAGEVSALESQLERTARDAQAERSEAAARLRAAAQGIRQSRLEDKIRYSRGVVRQRTPEFARNLEESIGADLDSLTARLEAAAGALGETAEDRLEHSLERTRDLANALESMRERLERQGAGDQPGDSAGQNRQEPADGPPGQTPGRGLSDEQARQMARELQQRRRELGEIRDELNRQGVETGELDNLLRSLGRFDNQGAVGTPRALSELAGVIIPGLKEFEFALRRALLAGDDPAAVAPDLDRVAPEYRAMVEEYYRRLGAGR